MTKPAPRAPTLNLSAYSKKHAWLLLTVILSIWAIDALFIKSQGQVTQSAALGALLSFSAQWVFTRFVFWRSGSQARRQIVGQLYRGQMLKWLIIGAGFALIFTSFDTLSAPALLIGFIVMQISQGILLAFLSHSQD